MGNRLVVSQSSEIVGRRNPNSFMFMGPPETRIQATGVTCMIGREEAT